MKKERIRRVFDLALKLELVKKMDCGELGVREISRVYSLLVITCSGFPVAVCSFQMTDFKGVGILFLKMLPENDFGRLFRVI